MTLIRGFRTELESLVGDGKGKGTSGSTMRPKVPMRQPESHCSIVAKKRSNVRGAKGAGHPRQGGVNGKPEELLVLAEAGRLPWGGMSRMNREIGSGRHGCESGKVKVLPPSVACFRRLAYPMRTLVTMRDLLGCKSHGCPVSLERHSDRGDLGGEQTRRPEHKE